MGRPRRSDLRHHPVPEGTKRWNDDLPLLPKPTSDSMRQFAALRALKPEQLATALTKLDSRILEPHMGTFNDLLMQHSQNLQLPELARLMFVVAEMFVQEGELSKRPLLRFQRSIALWLVPALKKMAEQAVLRIDSMECNDVAVSATLARACALILPWKKLLTGEDYLSFRRVLLTFITHTDRAAQAWIERSNTAHPAHTSQDLLHIFTTFSNVKLLSRNNMNKMMRSLLTLSEGLEDGELVRATIGDVSA